MDRKLNLIKNVDKVHEKRIFPRFPIGLMVFKEKTESFSYEVVDISLTGMQLEIKDGAISFSPGSKISGSLHWRGDEVDLGGDVQWVHEQRLGVKFPEAGIFIENLKNFLSLDNIVSHIRAIHENSLDFEIPNNLKYWLKADGVLEIFVWELPRSGISKFQIIFMEHYIEWIDGLGLCTGRVLTQRNLNTPLALEDEMIFEADDSLAAEKIHLAKRIIGSIDPTHIHHEDRDFILYKLKN